MEEFMDTDRCYREILGQLRAIATVDVTDVVGVSDGAINVRSTGELTREQRAAIASIEKGTGGLKVKFYDKLKALEWLGKAMGLFDGAAVEQPDNGLLQAILEATKQGE